MKSIQLQNSSGVALLAALFVLMVMSILSIGMLANVDEDIKISKNQERSERALKVAEAGLQIARSTFFDSAESNFSGDETRELHSVNGYIHGGYFLAQLTSGFTGQEKWTQWRYDIGLSGNNQESEITAPLRRVWATNDNGTNGSWSGTAFYAENLYGIVATGVYFPIAGGSDTDVRAHHEYTGRQNVWSTPNVDMSLIATKPTASDASSYAVNMSPMTTYTDYAGTDTRVAQIIYFTYSGSATDLSGSADTTSTVRLRAADAMNDMAGIWEFDTKLHGISTAPAMFELNPEDPNDPSRLIYFAVISQGAHTAYSPLPSGLTQTRDLNGTDGHDITSYPSEAQDYPEQIYLFALIDNGSSYTVKWNRPFPDPDVVEWTDYPTEHASATNGQSSPFVGRPSDMRTYLPEDDLVVDYRDGPGGSRATAYGTDNQWNQIRGNVFSQQGTPPSVSPPIVNVLYVDADGDLTERRQDAVDPLDPIIDVYLMYAMNSRVTFYSQPTWMPTPGDARHNYGNSILNVDGNAGWGAAGFRKPNALQTRIVALRDNFVRKNGNWDWNDAKSRFPEFKWSYRVPGYDPGPTDTIPADGYGEYSWDAWFTGQIAPMIMNHVNNSEDSDGDDRRGDRDEYGASFDGMSTAGTKNLYTVLYPYFKSTGFPTGGGPNNDNTSNAQGPTTGQGAPSNFNSQGWLDARIMVAALRDTWDDYKNGNRTNISGSNVANPELSNPVEPYWYYSQYDRDNGPNVEDHQYQDGTATVNYNASYTDEAGVASLVAPFPPGVQVGFPRPYIWSESLWNTNVRDAAVDGDSDPPEWSLYREGWEKAGFTSATADTSGDADIESETAAMCKDCLREDGLLVLPFNHDLETSPTDSTWNREDLRLHGINSRTGLHVWDYHIASSMAGDNANNTPAIANNKVFVAYMMFGAENNTANRKALITVLDANDGTAIDLERTIDEDADAVILSPTIANGMAYVATYDFNGLSGSNSSTTDEIRLFAMSPMIRLVSTGIYPASPNLNIDTRTDTVGTLNYSDTFKDTDTDYSVQRVRTARRRIQVWISGDTSRWEEVKEEIIP